MAGLPAEQVEELATRFGRIVYNAAYRVLGNADDAEDVLQSVFLRLLDGRRAIASGVSEWGAMLRTMATHAAIDLLRCRPRARFEPFDGFVSVPAETQSAVEVAEKSRMAATLREVLAELPQRDAQVFCLRHFEELSYDEIAGELGLSVSQVGVILHRGKAQLRGLLEERMSAGARKDSVR